MGLRESTSFFAGDKKTETPPDVIIERRQILQERSSATRLHISFNKPERSQSRPRAAGFLPANQEAELAGGDS
jgi:hypothetical protein